MEMKQNQAFFLGTYANPTYLFLSKNLQAFQLLLNSKFLSFMTTVNPINENEIKYFYGAYFYGAYSNLTSFFIDC